MVGISRDLALMADKCLYQQGKVVTANADKEVGGVYLPPEFGFDNSGLPVVPGGVQDEGIEAEGAAGKMGGMGVPVVGQKNHIWRNGFKVGCHLLDPPLPQLRITSGNTRVQPAKPVRFFNRQHLKSCNPAGGYKLLKPRLLPRLIAAKGHREIDHPGVIFTRQAQRQGAGQNFVIRVGRTEQKCRRTMRPGNRQPDLPSGGFANILCWRCLPEAAAKLMGCHKSFDKIQPLAVCYRRGHGSAKSDDFGFGPAQQPVCHGDMADITPVTAKKLAAVGIDGNRIVGGRHFGDRRIAMGAPEMGNRHADRGIKQGEIRGPVLIEVKDRVLNIGMERCLFPMPALLIMFRRGRAHHVFHGQGHTGKGVGLQDRHGKQKGIE